MAFITLDRKFLDWQWYGDINTKTVFIHLLLLANWDDTKYKGIILHRGEAAVTYDEISKKLGISYQQVRTAFQHLENAETLTIRRSSKFLIVTLKKYDEYQSKQQSNNNQITINQQSDNNQDEKKESNKERKEEIYDNNKHENHLTNKPIYMFAPPTLEEVKAYCDERKNGVDPERFINFYSSKGWMVGKNKMKDWKAAVRTWERDAGYSSGKAPKKQEWNFDPDAIELKAMMEDPTL